MPYGITVYPPSRHPSLWRAVAPYKYATHRGARVAARLASLFGLWVLGGHDVVGLPGPRFRDRYVAVETEDLDLERYRLGRRVA